MNAWNKGALLAVAFCIPLISACGTSGSVSIKVPGAEVEANWETSNCGENETKVGGFLTKCGKSLWGADDVLATVKTENVLVRESSGYATVYVYNSGQFLGSKTFNTTYNGASTYGMNITWSNPSAVESWLNSLDAGDTSSYSAKVVIGDITYEPFVSSGTAKSTITAYLDGDVLASATKTWNLGDGELQ